MLVLGATVKVADPAPEPVAPPVTVIQVALLAAVQLQPVVVVTVADPFPPAAATVCAVGEIENVHADAFCVTVNVCGADRDRARARLRRRVGGRVERDQAAAIAARRRLRSSTSSRC